MHDRLHDLGGVFADESGQEQVIEDAQVRLHPVLEQISTFAGVTQCVSGELGGVNRDAYLQEGGAIWS